MNKLIIGTQIGLIVVVIVAVALRIILMDGYILLPKIEGGRLRLNTLGTVVIGVIAVLGYLQTTTITDPLTIFLLAYTTPQGVDSVSKAIAPE